MDITYGEEIPLDAIAPLFAQSKASSSMSNRTLLVQAASTPSPPRQPRASTSKFIDIMQDDEEMEEGELLEEGEISEESSDESELVAETLIAPAYKAKKRNVASSLSTPSSVQDLSLRIAPSLSSSAALPFISPTLQPTPRLPPIPASSTPSSTSKLPPAMKDTEAATSPLQEYENLIDELYSYGVTCDYLINKGVTKDLVVGTFAQKGYKLPQHHLDRHLERQQQWREHQANLVGQQAPTIRHRQHSQERQQPQAKQEPAPLQHSAEPKPPYQALPTNHAPPPSLPNIPSIPPSTMNSHHRSVSNLSDTSLMRMGALLPTPPSSAPSTITTKRRRESQDISSSVPPSLSPPTLPSSIATASASTDKLSADLQALKEELARKEASAREALRARKAALAKQNAQRAENFIEGLFSASTTVEVPIASSSAPLQAMSQDVPPIASTSQSTSRSISDLEDYEEGEEVETAAPLLPLPPAATTVSSTDSPPTRPHPAHRSLSSTSFNQTSRFHRPKATDFEADPSHSLPNVPRWTEQLLESQRRLASASEMVIDLSDSEEEDNNDGYHVGDDDDSEDLDCYSSARIDEQVRQAAKENNVDEQLRQAVRASKMQDAVAFSSYNGHHQSSIYNPYSSYSLSNIAKASESARSSPAPVTAAGVVRRKVSPVPSTSRGSTPHLSINRSITSASTTSAPLSAPASTSTAGHATMSGNAELEAKQAEIKKMMEMIAKMESSKKQKKKKDTHISTPASMERDEFASSQASKETSSAPAVPTSNEGIETQQVESVVLQAAKEKVGQLLDEQEQLVSVMGTDEKEVGPLPCNATLPVPSSTVMRQGSSSDEAMSISSGDE